MHQGVARERKGWPSGKGVLHNTFDDGGIYFLMAWLNACNSYMLQPNMESVRNWQKEDHVVYSMWIHC